ncbi:hypothetical protein [Pedobacter sp. SYP-B3415]|uniref:hypothetical protein n=1 Tax=Pedobacter sp. SYP-B3415 TaxID=2496641 RepID=UPI00101BA2D6|nr:hypothetical protein [Pedobacter sp. SYP-B3415]
MKKVIYALVLPLAAVGGLVFAHQEISSETPTNVHSKLSAAERKEAMERWERSPDGISYKKWEASFKGKNVYASEAKIRKNINAFTNMEAVVSSLSLPPHSRLGFGLMVKINGVDYILSFGQEEADEFRDLHDLKVNDKITIRSHSVSHAPKYLYPIVSGDYVERDGEIIYKRAPRKGGC